MNKPFKASAAIGGGAVFFAAILWALDGVLREPLQHINPLTIVALEHLIGALIATPILILYRKRLTPLTRKQWLAIVLVGGLSGVVATTLFVEALFKVFFANFSIVILLQQLQPFFAVAASAVLLKEKVTPRFALLAVIAIFGAYLLNFPSGTVNSETGGATMTAGLLAIGAAAAWGTSTAFSKYALKDQFWPQIAALRFISAAAIGSVALMLLPAQNDLSLVVSSDVWRLLLIACTTGFVAVGIYYFGLQRIRASRATILELAFPLTAVIIGYVRFNNTLTVSQVIGGILIIAVSTQLVRIEATQKG